MHRIKHPPLDQVELTDVMHALSDPVRLGLVRSLADSKEPLTCAALYGDRPKSSMSHHFRILREAGLITTRKEGKEHFNTLRGAELEKRFPGLLKAVLRAME